MPITVKVNQYNALYNAWLHLPADYANTATRYPLLLFFHGSGEAGTNLNTVLTHGVPYWISQGNNMEFTNPADGQVYKFICVSIQHPSYSCNASNVHYALNDLIARYRIDTSRIYLTGLSAGGWSTMMYTTESQANANRIAAVVTLSTAFQDVNYSNLRFFANANLETWLFAGNSDLSYLSNARRAVDTINKYKAGLAKLTAYNGGHCCWNTYYNPAYRENGVNIYEWMLQYKNPGTANAPNQAPNANAGADAVITLPTSTATLNGSLSNDPDGTITTYAWSKLSGPAQGTIASPTLASTAVNNLAAGVYQFVLTVTDNGGLTDKDTVQVTVNAAPNQAPNANAGADISIAIPATSSILNGSASNDPDGNIVNYLWSKLSGPAQGTIASPSSVTTNVSNLTIGTYKFILVVTDNGGLTDRDTMQLTVGAAPNQAPNANAGADLSITLPANSAMLNGSLSNDPDGNITTYAWSKLSGPVQGTITSPTLATTAVNNLAAGVYQFVLTVTDNGGLTDRDTMQLIVNQVTAIGVQNTDDGTTVSIYPNPVKGSCVFLLKGFEAGATSMNIYTANGMLVQSKTIQVNTGQTLLNESFGYLQPGRYYIEFVNKKKFKKYVSFLKL